MKSKEEILDHLSKTVYTHNARRSIVAWMLQHHVIDYKCQIKFAKHVYNRDGVIMTKGLSYEDFLEFIGLENILKEMDEAISEYVRHMNDASCNLYYVDPVTHLVQIKSIEHIADDFRVGDAVKYVPTPDESSTEYVEAIAHGSNGETYLCLSNGEYVKTCYCVKYKAQGEERCKLIDKLNEVI